MISLRAKVVLLVSLMTSGCVWFQTIPAESVGCDPDLVGLWETTEDNERERIDIPSDCVIRDPKDPDSSETLKFRTFELDGVRYAAIEAGGPRKPGMQNRDSVGDWPQDRVMLFRYRIDGTRLSYWSADINAALKIDRDDIVVHTTVEDLDGNPVSADVVRKLEPPYVDDVYLTGSRQALAAVLREHSNALFSELDPKKATVLFRVETEAHP